MSCDTVGVMRSAVCIIVCLAATLGSAQTTSIAPAPPQGVTAEWDVRAYMQAMATDLARMGPIFAQVSPAEWVAKGAPDAYVRQLQSTQAGMRALIVATEKLAREPEKLTTALDAFFQMERMELLIGSLLDGVRRYQSSELADTLTRSFAENTVHRDRLRQHIRDLAATREQEYGIINAEAQRCRGMISQQPPPSTAKKPLKTNKK